MSTRTLVIDQQLTEEELSKKKIIESMGKLDYVILDLKKSINENYQKIYEASTKKTLREYFSENIAEIVNDNKSYGIPQAVPEENICKIQAGQLKYNIHGFIQTCSNPDLLILTASVQKNVPALRYSEIEGRWQEVTTTLIRFRTVEGEYLYVSALNLLKSEASAEKYLQRLDNHYYYKNRNTASA